jgi:DNA-binding transcriptional MerR regulator
MESLTRGELAQRVGVNPETLRFYEKEGLLSPDSRTPSGYRQFAESAVDRLEFVRRAKGLGFSLTEIRELLLLQEGDAQNCVEVRDRLRNKLAVLLARKAELESLEAQLRSALRKCDRQLKQVGPQQKNQCPVLKQIAGSTRPRSR